ncbi:radical SAM protein [Candidatus Sumerlaeota bacterium]|nr:radical SAM protein [Candidatus Sumerlaeota bacterium]
MNSSNLKYMDDNSAKNIIRLHAMFKQSRSNGPGCRTVIWTQGCPFHCNGCFNPRTHSLTEGELFPIRYLVDFIMKQKDSIEGITITGGEPLIQSQPLAAFLELLHKKSPPLSVILLTGYQWEEIGLIPDIERILNHTDVVIAGRFELKRRISSGLRGSSNKTIHLLTERYCLEEIENTPPAEIAISPEGEIIISGIDPPIYTNPDKEAP